MIAFPGVERLWAALPEARIVGGAVRDTLARRDLADVDFASPLTPDAAMARLKAAGIRVIPTGLAHGTVTALAAGRNFEITTLRRDVETDGRHAVVAFTDDWQADAARRDFTINAMSMSRDGALYDYFGGQADLAAGIVRFVGDPRARITEDYLRILRFFRFFARYATAPDAPAVAAIEEFRDGILNLSAERVWSELKRILQAPDPRAALALMQATGVLARILPDGADVDAANALITRNAPADPLLRFAALLTGDAETAAARLRLSNEELAHLLALRQPNTLAPAATDADLRRALADTPAAILTARTWLAPSPDGDWDTLRHRLATTPPPIFPLQGRDLTALGIPPGPEIGKTLAAIRTWWLANGCTPNHDACRQQAVILSGL
jgi:poly(A) polymerase/tRNA nucleotidyltransferase (CCA-adding enzyme)